MNKKVKDQLFKRSMWTLLAVFFALIMIIFLIAAPIAANYSMFVDQFFGIESRKQQIKSESSDPADYQYYTSEFAKKDENGKYLVESNREIMTQVLDTEAMRKRSEEIALQAVSEGTVVLWNNKQADGKKALPLAKGNKISNFGLGTLNYIHHGVGSGKVDPSSEDRLDVVKALTREGVGLELNPECISAINTGKAQGYSIMLGATNDIPWSKYSSTAKNSVVAYKDAALFMITRYFGEGSTNKNNTSSSAYDKDGNMFTLSSNELSVLDGLKDLKQKGRLNKIVVAINSPTPFNLKGFDQAAIDACLWIGWGGEMGPESLGDVLVGNVEPSGHLTDTWAYDMYSAPAANNFGNYTYSSMPMNAPKDHNAYVVYQEGIYVGYRYYETRYEDVVLGKGNAADAVGGIRNKQKWSYTDEVAYTFGHGAGYNDYAYSNVRFNKSGDNYTVNVTVTNNGTMVGKDAVQVYLQKPYTQYDIDNGIEKSAVELVGFAKTPDIQPGKSTTVTITVPEYEFKSYDANGYGTYILEGGAYDYYLAVGQNAHDALNNILAAKNKTVADGMDYDGNKNFVKSYRYGATDAVKYSKGANDNEISNQFDNADLLRNAEMKPSVTAQDFKYLSRNDWKNTWRGGVELALVGDKNAEMVAFEKEIPNNPDDKMPIYGTDTSEFGHLVLAQMINLPYDDPLWDDLLNEMTFAQQEKLMSSCAVAPLGEKEENSIMSPGINQQDGPVGLRNTHFALPSNPVNACTFNTDLINDLGVVFGTEMLAKGWGGVYGLGCNTHRTPWGGRAYEYYSEDGFLGGAISSAETKGMRQMGVILYTKHFALNDQEMNRGIGVNTWSNEQAIREIYLKQFETSIREGGCNGLMTSYNAIGTTWAGSHKGLLTNVLRKEWGFTGITITDACGSNPYMGGSSSVHAFANIAGQDAWMGNFKPGALNKYYEDKNATVCLAVRESAHRILYTQCNSLMMNGVSADTRFRDITPAWETWLVVGKVLPGILMGICIAMTAASWVVWYLDKNKKEKTN